MPADLLEYTMRGWQFERLEDGGTKITHRSPEGLVLGVLELNLEEWLDVLEHLIHARRTAALASFRPVKWKAPSRRGS